MRSLFYTWACFMVSQFMYRVLVTILTQQGPRYLFANEGRIVCSWRAISYVRHGFVSCALCDSHSNTVKRWAGAWLNDELRWMLINLWLWHRLRRSSNWSWELLSTVGWMTAADLTLCVLVSGEAIVLRLNVRDFWPDLSVVYSRVFDMIEECTTPQRLWERARDSNFCQCWMTHTKSHKNMCLWRLCGHCFTRELVSWYLSSCTVYWSPY